MGRIFRLYEEHAAAWDAEFRRVRERFAGQMQCGRGCSACCSQMFTISALEAAVVTRAVADLPERDRSRLQDRARAYVARAADYDLVGERDGEECLTPRTGVRLPCPALRDDACSIYDARPLICRKWGMPVYDPSRPDRLHACELNFRAGDAVDARDIVAAQTALLERWGRLKQEAGGEIPNPERRVTVAEAILAGAGTSLMRAPR